jgi:hypothetical protein
MSNDIDDLEAALRASGWATRGAKTLLSRDDMAVAEKLLGETNARRMAVTPVGQRPRLVHTKEVYAVENSHGWMVGALEGGKPRVLNHGLSREECSRVLAFARDRGFKTAVYDNPGVRPLAREQPRRREAVPEQQRRRQTITPSAHLKPSKRFQMLKQLGNFKA